MCAREYAGIAYLFFNSKPTKVAVVHEIWNSASRRCCHRHRYDIVEEIIYDEAVMRARARAKNLSVELCVAFARNLALGRIDFTLAFNFATIRIAGQIARHRIDDSAAHFHFPFRVRER